MTHDRDPSDWLNEEKQRLSPTLELARLKLRALRHRGLVVVMTLGMAAALTVRTSRKPGSYQATVTFNLSEEHLDVGVAPETKAQLSEYIFGGIFTRPRCLELIKTHGLEPDKVTNDANWAIEAMRDRIDIDVSRNYFLEGSSDTRTARVAITYTDKTPEKAVVVARDLARLVREHETATRYAQATAALERANRRVEDLKRELRAAQDRMIQFRAPNQRTSPSSPVLRNSMEKARRLSEILRGTEAAQVAAALRASLEKQGLAMRFEQVDFEPPATHTSDWRVTAFKGTVLFFMFLPLVGLGVGAADNRVYDLDDVKRLGMEALGHVPPFHGMRVGSLDQRLLETRAGPPGRSVIPATEGPGPHVP